jgi:transcriptional regulator with XRE-family HTH domain
MNSEEIKRLRLSKKLTQEQLGELCGVEKASVSKWEKAKTQPSGSSRKILEQLASGDLVVTQVSDLELKLLDQNVETGGFADREEYLTASLKHLLVHGRFMDLERPALKVAEEGGAYGLSSEDRADVDQASADTMSSLESDADNGRTGRRGKP